MLCKNCGENVNELNCCERCVTKAVKKEYCLMCMWNTSCARCGNEIPYSKDNINNVIVCSSCENEMYPNPEPLTI